MPFPTSMDQQLRDEVARFVAQCASQVLTAGGVAAIPAEAWASGPCSAQGRIGSTARFAEAARAGHRTDRERSLLMFALVGLAALDLPPATRATVDMSAQPQAVLRSLRHSLPLPPHTRRFLEWLDTEASFEAATLRRLRKAAEEALAGSGDVLFEIDVDEKSNAYAIAGRPLRYLKGDAYSRYVRPSNSMGKLLRDAASGRPSMYCRSHYYLRRALQGATKGRLDIVRDGNQVVGLNHAVQMRN